jgi:NAD+ synthase
MKCKEISEYISGWMLDYSNSCKSNGFVVGISGGIDSALTSTLAAATGKDVLCVEMPIHQPKNQVNRAQQHIKWLKENYKNVSSISIDLSDIYDTFSQKNSENSENENHHIALVNTRARLRMTSLYYYAQLNNYLVAGTGNKVEDFGIGFYTKFGDGGVDISPIADLLKTEVFQLSKSLNVIDAILKAAPTDGLWEDDRTDEDQIGATYPELEWAMSFYGKTDNLTDRQKEVLTIYNSFHTKNLHKMIPIPICKIPQKFI